MGSCISLGLILAAVIAGLFNLREKHIRARVIRENSTKSLDVTVRAAVEAIEMSLWVDPLQWSTTVSPVAPAGGVQR